MMRGIHLVAIHRFCSHLSCNEFPALQVQRDHVRCVKESNHLALRFALQLYYFE